MRKEVDEVVGLDEELDQKIESTSDHGDGFHTGELGHLLCDIFPVLRHFERREDKDELLVRPYIGVGEPLHLKEPAFRKLLNPVPYSALRNMKPCGDLVVRRPSVFLEYIDYLHINFIYLHLFASVCTIIPYHTANINFEHHRRVKADNVV
jgi:hypothetical protein